MSNKIDLSGGKQQLRPHGINNTKDGLKAHSRSYPDAATRIIGADVGLNDIGTIALQEDTNSLWLLTALIPVTWHSVGSYGMAFEEILVDTVLTEDQAGYHFFVVPSVTVTLPTSPANGTKYSFAFMGTDASILCGGTNTFVGRNDLAFGVTQIRGTSMSGMVIVAKDLSTFVPGMFGWFIEGGQGQIEDYSDPTKYYDFNLEFKYTNSTPMPSAVGGWEASSTFSRQTLQEMLDGLLYPYQYPAFSAFAMAGQSTPVEVGASLLVDPSFSWTATNTGNIAAGSLEIVDVTSPGSPVLATGLDHDASPHAVTLAAITKTTATSHVFRITGENSKTQTFTRDATYTWLWKSYYGTSASASLNEAAIEGLNDKVLATGFAGTYVFGAGDYKYICYAAVLGTASSFKDSSTMLDVAMEAAATVSVTNVNGVTTNYNVHRTTNVIGSAITIVVA